MGGGPVEFCRLEIDFGLTAGLAILIIFGITLAIKYNSKVRAIFEQTRVIRFLPVLKKIGIQLDKFFHFGWLYSFLRFFLQILRKWLTALI
jgi:hypothetical protein